MTDPAPIRPKRRPVVLAVLDGWGHRVECEDNAICQAKKPVWDRWMATCPHALLDASELHVGLPPGQMGNSEVGHMNLGAGRVVMQDLPRIDRAIADGSLARAPATRIRHAARTVPGCTQPRFPPRATPDVRLINAPIVHGGDYCFPAVLSSSRPLLRLERMEGARRGDCNEEARGSGFAACAGSPPQGFCWLTALSWPWRA